MKNDILKITKAFCTLLYFMLEVVNSPKVLNFVRNVKLDCNPPYQPTQELILSKLNDETKAVHRKFMKKSFDELTLSMFCIILMLHCNGILTPRNIRNRRGIQNNFALTKKNEDVKQRMILSQRARIMPERVDGLNECMNYSKNRSI